MTTIAVRKNVTNIDQFSKNFCLQSLQMFLFAKSIPLEMKKKTELNEQNKLECSKTPLQMSSYAQKHVFLYLNAQTNIKTLLY